METTRSERIRLGIFIFATLLLLFGTVAFLVGQRLMDRHVEYHTRFSESVEGLNLGAKVKLNGIDVGQVTRIVIDEKKLTEVIVWFEVADGTPIKSGMSANLVGGMSLTGLKSIEITGGSAESADLDPGALVPAGTSSLKQLTGQAESIALKTEQIMNNLIALTNPQNIEHFSSMMAHLDNVAMRADSLLGRNASRIDSIPAAVLGLVHKSSGTVDEIQKAKLGEKIATTLDDMDRTVLSLQKTVAELDKTLAASQDAATAAGTLAKRTDQTVYRNQEDLTVAVRHLREAMENLNDLSRQVRENPSLLLRGEDKQRRSR